jgi:antitoxin component YwqK of YwqJK toxin-antitoxin module
MKLNNIINKIKSINPNIKFVGQFDENNLKTGYWEVYWRNGKLYSKGNYLNGSLDGYWEAYRRNENLMWKGNFKDGIKEGYWEYYCYNGDLIYKGDYKIGEFYEIK